MPHRSQFGITVTFDDILLLPEYVDFSRADISLDTKLSRNISLKIPLVSSPMDTVTESRLAIALARLGGIGIIHRNLTVAKQAAQVKLVNRQKLLVGAAVGVSAGFEDRVDALVKAGVSILLVDSAHGFSSSVIACTKYIKKHYPKLDVVAGNIARAEAARALIAAGADGLRVGMGPGAICTTRIVSGVGVPQVAAIREIVPVARKAKVPVIADGGIKYSGDIVKALALGANTVMMGSFFASSEESPGKVIRLNYQQVPGRFSDVLKTKRKFYLFKEYRGMGSIGAMEKGAKIKSEDEYHGKNYKDRVLVAEGVEGLVPVKGNVRQIVEQALGGVRSGMYYTGSKNISQLQRRAKFIRITSASLTENHPHGIFITNAGKNY